MEVLIHLVIELAKISILGCIYATLILIIIKIIANNKPNSWFGRLSRKKLRLWCLSGLFISGGLFFFMFTHFGDHGLGDSARIPVGHWRAIQEVNGTQAYLQDDDISALEIESFIITDDYVYGLAINSNENYEGRYFVYDLINNNVKTFTEKRDFANFLVEHNLDSQPNYKDFSYYYKEHWNGWRLWLLA